MMSTTESETPSPGRDTGKGPPSTLSSLEQELAFLVRWLEAVQRRRSYALERAHYLMLLLLIDDGPQSVTRLAERLRLDASTVTRQVTMMSRCGLVRKQRNPEDGRGGMIRATDKGREEAARMREQREERIGILFRDWNESRRRSLAALLGDLNDSLCRVLDDSGE